MLFGKRYGKNHMDYFYWTNIVMIHCFLLAWESGFLSTSDFSVERFHSDIAFLFQIVIDIASRFFHPDTFDIRLNHAQILEAIWSWVGIDGELRQNIAEVWTVLIPLIDAWLCDLNLW